MYQSNSSIQPLCSARPTKSLSLYVQLSTSIFSAMDSQSGDSIHALYSIYEGRSKSSWPDLVLFRIILKLYLLLIVARLRTQHAQFDFWAINILCISAHEQSVCQMVSRMLTPEECTSFWRTSRTMPTWPSKIFFTIRYSGWNVYPPLRFWVRTTKHAMERTNRSKLFFRLRNSVFFHVKCKQPMTAKMHKIFTAHKSYWACRVLSLPTIRSKYYFNFLLNRTRSSR